MVQWIFFCFLGEHLTVYTLVTKGIQIISQDYRRQDACKALASCHFVYNISVFVPGRQVIIANMRLI